MATALLLAMQGPLSALAAKHISVSAFICVTQVALLFSVPLLTISTKSRREFFALLRERANYGRLVILTAIGIIGLLLYEVALKGAHPVIIAAIMDLSPFWAAIVARAVTGSALPVRPILYGLCFAAALGGAMTIAWSQTDWKTAPFADILKSYAWTIAIPIPVFYALSGTLVGKWLSQYDDAATIAASFLVSSALFVPPTLFLALRKPHAAAATTTPAILLLFVGTVASAAIGRVLYQVALTRTNNDNAFVTMFFLLVPGLSALLSWPMSWFVSDLAFASGPLFF